MSKATARIEIDAPAQVEAGQDLAFCVRVLTDPVLDLAGTSLRVRFAPDMPAAPGAADEGETISLAVHDGSGTETDDLVCTAPDAAGPHVWRVTLPAGQVGGIDYPETSADFAFEVLPERPGIAVWNVPPTVTRGEGCTVRVGAKCPSGASLAGAPVEIRDSTGTIVARGQLGAQPSEGGSGLYHADIALALPEEEALHRYAAHLPGRQQAPSRQKASFAFSLRVVPAPEVTVRLRVTRAADGAAQEGLHVRLHPYRSTTDADGRAELSLPKGHYTLHVSGRRFVPHSQPLDVAGDTELSVCLDEEAPYEHL